MTCKSFSLLLAAVFVFATSILCAQSCSELTGSWMNQDSSILHVELIEDGKFVGAYQSNASDDARLWTTHGTVNDEKDIATMAWMVNWGEYGSITSWTGYCKEKNGVPTITTQWYLVRPYVTYDWERFVVNQSVFTPLKR